jgi:hypothetical protein
MTFLYAIPQMVLKVHGKFYKATVWKCWVRFQFWTFSHNLLVYNKDGLRAACSYRGEMLLYTSINTFNVHLNKEHKIIMKRKYILFFPDVCNFHVIIQITLNKRIT